MTSSECSLRVKDSGYLLHFLQFRAPQGTMTAYSFRAAASSMLNESGKWNADAIEAQLAHVEGNLVRRAYARAEFWEERLKLMAWWADRLDELRRGGEVVPISAARQRG